MKEFTITFKSKRGEIFLLIMFLLFLLSGYISIVETTSSLGENIGAWLHQIINHK